MQDYCDLLYPTGISATNGQKHRPFLGCSTGKRMDVSTIQNLKASKSNHSPDAVIALSKEICLSFAVLYPQCDASSYMHSLACSTPESQHPTIDRGLSNTPRTRTDSQGNKVSMSSFQKSSTCIRFQVAQDSAHYLRPPLWLSRQMGT